MGKDFSLLPMDKPEQVIISQKLCQFSNMLITDAYIQYIA